MPFLLSKNSEIIIYGYNNRGIAVYKNLEKQGYSLFGFLDKNEINMEEGIAVLKPENLEISFFANKEVVIFIALQNAMKHDKIASKLYKKGFKNIIYLPTDSVINEDQACRLREFYNQILTAEEIDVKAMPIYTEVVNTFLSRENGIIEKRDQTVTFWARIEVIFSNDICAKTVNSEGLQYYGVSLPLIKHYIGIFKQMESGYANNDELYNYCKAQSYIDETGNILKAKIKDRYQLFLLYKRSFNEGMKFFISSAPLVAPNQKGGFHIKDGLHRSVFLMMQRLSYLPVTIRNDDFEKTYPQEKIEKIKKFMLENSIFKTVTPISHPAFYKFPAEKENIEKSVLTAIKEFLGISFLQHKKVLDMSDYNSYFARNMSRMCKEEETAYIESWESDEILFGLAQMLNEILNIKGVVIQYKSVMDIDQYFDIIFLMGKWKQYEYSTEVCRKLSLFTREMLFWESTSEDIENEIKDIMNNSNFVKYHRIHQLFDGEMFREVGVFLKL